jgi:hypothetical protein
MCIWGWTKRLGYEPDRIQSVGKKVEERVTFRSSFFTRTPIEYEMRIVSCNHIHETEKYEFQILGSRFFSCYLWLRKRWK